MKTRRPVKTSKSKARIHPARPNRADCKTWNIMGGGPYLSLERDLDGRLFIVEDKMCGERGVPHSEISRREIGYSEALNFIATHTIWKHPWKVLAHHGIKRPSTAKPTHKP